MKTFNERDIENAARTAFAPPHYVTFEADLQRAVAALRRDPVLDFLRAHDAFAEPVARLTRAAARYAQSAGWCDGDQKEIAERLHALVEEAERKPATSVEVQSSGDVMVEGKAVPEAEVKAAILEGAVVLETLAEKPSQKRAKVAALITALTSLGGLAAKAAWDGFFEIGLPPLWEKFIGADKQTIAATTSDSPRLFRIGGEGVCLRAAEDRASGVRLKLKKGDLVQLVERGESGWALVQAQVSGDSFEQGWVATIYLDPADSLE